MAEFKMPRYKYKGDTIPFEEFYQDGKNYQSPMEILHQGWETKLEDGIFKAVLNYGVSVDKDELIKALKYDRDQYEKGYADGCKGAMDRIKAEVAREIILEIDTLIRCHANGDIDDRNLYIFFDKLKKKYTEDKE